MEEERRKAFIAAAMDAWFATSIELDRSLLSLSAGGIALLITLVSFKGISTHWQLVLFVLALVSFLACIVVVLTILRTNKPFLEKLVNGAAAESSKLDVLDAAARGTFILAVILSVVLGIAAAIKSVNTAEEDMANKSKGGDTQLATDSFSGALNLAGGEVLKKSYSGAQNLAPPPPAQQQPATGGQQGSTQPAGGNQTKPGG